MNVNEREYAITKAIKLILRNHDSWFRGEDIRKSHSIEYTRDGFWVLVDKRMPVRYEVTISLKTGILSVIKHTVRIDPQELA